LRWLGRARPRACCCASGSSLVKSGCFLSSVWDIGTLGVCPGETTLGCKWHWQPLPSVGPAFCLPSRLATLPCRTRLVCPTCPNFSFLHCTNAVSCIALPNILGYCLVPQSRTVPLIYIWRCRAPDYAHWPGYLSECSSRSWTTPNLPREDAVRVGSADSAIDLESTLCSPPDGVGATCAWWQLLTQLVAADQRQGGPFEK
jgi:hypothetical protein